MGTDGLGDMVVVMQADEYVALLEISTAFPLRAELARMSALA